MVSPQILAEVLVVVTNPNTLPKAIPKEEAYAHVDELRCACRVVATTPGVTDRLMRLLRATGISGKRVHDVLHAATMLANGITGIYTYDAGFRRPGNHGARSQGCGAMSFRPPLPGMAPKKCMTPST